MAVPRLYLSVPVIDCTRISPPSASAAPVCVYYVYIRPPPLSLALFPIFPARSLSRLGLQTWFRVLSSPAAVIFFCPRSSCLVVASCLALVLRSCLALLPDRSISFLAFKPFGHVYVLKFSVYWPSQDPGQNRIRQASSSSSLTFRQTSRNPGCNQLPQIDRCIDQYWTF
ncbi:hypothetical protein DFH06DRAFT_1193344 [Mycena polygramma]|nr:hypothetical protein DFH06DRAFT_1193344 [Mycena polygramma]